MKQGWTEYCVTSPRGNPSNHHWTSEGNIGERVKPHEATCKIVVWLNDNLAICKVETLDL